jgi:two-component system chemotaxis response regulator CheB
VVTAIRSAHEARGSAYRAVAARVAAVHAKPGDAEGWRVLGRELAATLTALTRVRAPARDGLEGRIAGPSDDGLRVVGIGASAGGPHALRDVLAAAGPALRARVAVVQHIATGFEAGLAEWLASETHLDVRVASATAGFEPGCVRIAPSDRHIVVTPDLELRLDESPAVGGHRPSVSVLFRSLRGLPAHAVGAVLLSGMGDDGVDEMLELRRTGAFTVAQQRSTCAVPGMPRAAVERDAAARELPPREIGLTLRPTISRRDRS